MHAPNHHRHAFARAAAAVFHGTLAACFVFLLVSRPAMAADAATAPSRVAAQDAGHEEVSADFEHSHESEFFRDLAGGEIDAARMRRMWADSKAMPSERPAAVQATNTWQLAGPVFSVNPGGGFMTGRVRDIDPVNVRALAASGGLWRFDLFGGIAMCDSVPASWFGSFATSPMDANTILLGTGEYHQRVGTGLYKTTDGGATWTHKAMSPETSWFSRVRWAPDGSAAFASSDDGLYRSTDGGETWSRRTTVAVSDFTSVPGVPGLMLAAQPNQGLLRSVDGGVTWTQLLGSGVPYGVTGLGAVSAVYNGATGHVCIYAAFDTSIWRSIDDGATWTNVTPSGFGIGNSGYGPAISVCPSDPNTVLYGNVPIVRTTDGGAHWTKFADPNLHADFHVFAWDANGVGVWAGHDGGWSHSLDKGVTWSSSSNVMPISQFYSIDCEKTEPGYMIGGTQDNNILYTPTPALNWVDPALSSTEGDATGAVIDLYNPAQMWAVSGVSGGAIAYPRYHTTDGGTTWAQVDNGIDANGATGLLRSDGAFNPWLYTSTDYYVYESQDAGATWNKTNPGAPFPAAVRSLTSSFRLTPSALLYVTLNTFTAGQRVYVRDGGAWYARDTGLPAGSVTRVVPHPWSGNYADEAWAIVGPGVYHTLDRGVTWTNASGDLPPSTTISDLVPNPRHPGEWYVGTMIGCYRTTNGGVNWEHWNNGMPPAAIVTQMSYIDLTSTTGQFFVVAATYGRSVWKRDVSGDDIFPSLTVSDAYAQEGNAGQSTMWFRVQLSQRQLSQSVIVDYATQDSTATLADNDYVATSGTLTFAPGETYKWVGVTVNGDTQIEADETLTLVLSNPVRATIANSGVGTIQDDDSHGLACNSPWVTDGAVYAIATTGNTVYVGGTFARVGAPTGCAASLDAVTGLPVSLPKIDGSLMALAPDGLGGWYLGGGFRHVGGQPRTNLAHLLADGSLDPWNPVANGYVLAITAVGTAVYVGGSFTSIGGIPHPYLAAINSVSGLPGEWDPQANGQVSALAYSNGALYVGGGFTSIGGQLRNHAGALVAASGAATSWNPNANADVGVLMIDGGAVYAAGSFTNIGGQPRGYLAALDPASGLATAWNPGADNLVFSLASDAGAIYAAGAFTTIGGQARPNLAALDRSTGLATAWAPNPDGNVNALAVTGSLVYAGGTYGNIGGQLRNNLAALSAATGLATAWNPDPDKTVSVLGIGVGSVFAGGVFNCLAAQPRATLAAFDALSGQLLPWNPGSNGSVLTLAAAGGTVYAGGSFTSIGGQLRNRIAAIDSVSGLATAWDPNANSTVRTLLLQGTLICAGGNFTSIGGAARNRIAAMQTKSSTATTWNPNASGAVYSIVTDGTSIYAGGAFGSIGGQLHSGLAMLNGTTGAGNATWNPDPNGTVYALLVSNGGLFVGGAFTQIATVSRPRLALISLTTRGLSTWAPAPDDVVYALAPSGASSVYAGGAFTQAGGQARSHLALMRPGTNQVAPWTPEPDGAVYALGASGSTLFAGGAFTSLGGMPQANFGCVIPAALVDVMPSAPGNAFTLRLSPNPTSGRVRVDYDLPEAAHVSIAVYDLQGRRVGPAIEMQQAAGARSGTWEAMPGRDVSPGVYFLHFAAGARYAVRRFAIL